MTQPVYELKHIRSYQVTHRDTAAEVLREAAKLVEQEPHVLAVNLGWSENGYAATVFVEDIA